MYVLGGGALSIIVLNLAFTFFIPDPDRRHDLRIYRGAIGVRRCRALAVGMRLV